MVLCFTKQVSWMQTIHIMKKTNGAQVSMSFFLLCLRDPSFTSGVLDWLHFWTILFCRSCGLIIQGKSRKQETRIVTTWGSDGRDGGVFLLSFNKLYLVDPVQLLLFPLFGESEDMKTKWEKIQKIPLSWSKPPVTFLWVQSCLSGADISSLKIDRTK